MTIGALWRDLLILQDRVDALETKLVSAIVSNSNPLTPPSSASGLDSTRDEPSDPVTPTPDNAVQVDAAPTGAQGGIFCKFCRTDTCQVPLDLEPFPKGCRVVVWDRYSGIKPGTVVGYRHSSLLDREVIQVQIDRAGIWQGDEQYVMRVPDEWKAG